MRVFIRDFCIACLSLTGIAYAYRFIVGLKGPLVRIVVFHDVRDALWFEKTIATLAQNFHVVSPEDFSSRTFDPKSINILITFDDGYASWVTTVLPVLERYGIQGLFFVNSGLIDIADDTTSVALFMKNELKIQPRDPLSWDGVRTLFERGHTIGSHGYHHVNLRMLGEHDLVQTLRKDKERIESVLGTPVLHCAYPFGTKEYVDARVGKGAQNVGFLYGYTAISRFVGFDETFQVPRMCIEDEMTPQMLTRWVFGAYDLFTAVKSIFR